VRFFFSERGVAYVVTLHSFGNTETTALLGRLIAELRPVASLHAPARPRRGTTVRIGSTGPRAIAAAPDAVWILSRDQPINPAKPWAGTRMVLLALDPRTGAVKTRILVRGEARGLAAGADAVWLAVADPLAERGTVLRIDPKTRRVVAQVLAGTWPTSLAADSGGVWVVNSAPFYKPGRLLRVAATTNRLAGRAVPLGRAPSGITLGAGAVWVADALEGTVRRIDPSRRRVLAKIRVGRQPYGLAFAAGSVWVTNSDDSTLTRIDASTNRVVAAIRVGRDPYGIAADSRSLWVANVGAGTVSQIDASSGRLVRRVAVGTEPLAVAVTSGGVWVTHNSDGRVTRL
jgi:YVTN family beta-propeller protein